MLRSFEAYVELLRKVSMVFLPLPDRFSGRMIETVLSVRMKNSRPSNFPQLPEYETWLQHIRIALQRQKNTLPDHPVYIYMDFHINSCI
jgi:hypothetical protein